MELDWTWLARAKCVNSEYTRVLSNVEGVPIQIHKLTNTCYRWPRTTLPWNTVSTGYILGDDYGIIGEDTSRNTTITVVHIYSSTCGYEM